MNSLRYFILIVSCVGLDFAGCENTSVKDGLVENIILKPDSVSFGTISSTNELNAQITIFNNNNRSVHVRDLVTSCGCTNVKIDSMEIQSMGSSQIIIRIPPSLIEQEIHEKLTLFFENPKYVVDIPVTGKFVLNYLCG